MKKNIRKIPNSVLSKLKTIKKNEVVAACAKTYRHEDLSKRHLSHLGISVNDKGINFIPAIIPSANQGKYSAMNVNGQEIVRKDLGLQTAYHPAETPNWGDSSYGTHTVYLPHKEYVRDFRAPKELQILIDCVGKKDRSEAYILVFRVDEVLDKTSPDFKKSLLENLNLLQESIGACGVEPAETRLEDYAKTLHVSWEILPPGSKEEAMERLFRGKVPSNTEKETAEERYDFFDSLDPEKLVIGTSGFRRYFGALLKDDLVIFENIEYGNAIYIFYDDWQKLSQKTRLELLSGRFGRNFDRVIHQHGWKGYVRAIIKEKRRKKTQ